MSQIRKVGYTIKCVDNLPCDNHANRRAIFIVLTHADEEYQEHSYFCQQCREEWVSERRNAMGTCDDCGNHPTKLFSRIENGSTRQLCKDCLRGTKIFLNLANAAKDDEIDSDPFEIFDDLEVEFNDD